MQRIHVASAVFVGGLSLACGGSGGSGNPEADFAAMGNEIGATVLRTLNGEAQPSGTRFACGPDLPKNAQQIADNKWTLTSPLDLPRVTTVRVYFAVTDAEDRGLHENPFTVEVIALPDGTLAYESVGPLLGAGSTAALADTREVPEFDALANHLATRLQAGDCALPQTTRADAAAKFGGTEQAWADLDADDPLVMRPCEKWAKAVTTDRPYRLERMVRPRFEVTLAGNGKVGWVSGEISTKDGAACLTYPNTAPLGILN